MFHTRPLPEVPNTITEAKTTCRTLLTFLTGSHLVIQHPEWNWSPFTVLVVKIVGHDL